MTLVRCILLLRIAGLLLAVAGTEAGENPPVSGDAPPSLGGDPPPNKGSPAAPEKGSLVMRFQAKVERA